VRLRVDGSTVAGARYAWTGPAQSADRWFRRSRLTTSRKASMALSGCSLSRTFSPRKYEWAAHAIRSPPAECRPAPPATPAQKTGETPATTRFPIHGDYTTGMSVCVVVSTSAGCGLRAKLAAQAEQRWQQGQHPASAPNTKRQPSMTISGACHT